MKLRQITDILHMDHKSALLGVKMKCERNARIKKDCDDMSLLEIIFVFRGIFTVNDER